MQSHQLAQADQDFRAAFEACMVAPAQFNHAAHVQLAYIYLVEADVNLAVQKMRDALLNFLDHNGIEKTKFHETITRAWVMAVHHFMNKAASTSSADFIAKNSALLDNKIMLTHYSASVLFSADARASFVEPDLDPIPMYGEKMTSQHVSQQFCTQNQ
jgi:hypothetical protein